MSTKLTQAHMDQIAAMRIQAANGEIGYWQIYQTLANLLQSAYGYSATNPTVLWLRGATQANAGHGSMSELIRGYYMFILARAVTTTDLKRAQLQVFGFSSCNPFTP